MPETIYVVAGGPSLINFDWPKLDDKRVIVVNRAFQKLPNAEVVYFSDVRFFNMYETELLKHDATLISGSRLDHASVEKYSLTGIKGLDLTPGCLRSGNNSGYAAINLAVHKFAKRIILLGFDMKFSNDHHHWHDGYHMKGNQLVERERKFSKMIPYFKYLVEPLNDLGIEIINACPDSALEAFPKATINEIL